MIEGLLHPGMFGHENARVWIALWDQIPDNAILCEAHRTNYPAYRAMVAETFRAAAAAKGRTIHADMLAVSFICLVDGFGLRRGLDPVRFSDVAARNACRRYINDHGLSPSDPRSHGP
jgi:hypothetical protein